MRGAIDSFTVAAMNAVLALYCKHYWESEGDEPKKMGKDGVGAKVSAESQEVKSLAETTLPCFLYVPFMTPAGALFCGL